ncbi:SDR family NAD(P)-dependent oxidoreductase [Bacteroides uniformis]|jgi:3-oxoacyl-[acyl-carrier protein] reductase|uniref:SDR family NAD(P)-dependent oxidoreductase n=1 Tax=Bacteroides uniformis TaxID=820 RepID=UPI000E5702D2|nr:SDR family oxidoreductase [Bacteroides uniformis]RHD63676.1 SDR family NAD(P)-dependent oxidoreductase [Bacteroides uniformis]
MERLLENKVCLVTGAAKGIGRTIAERYAKDGAFVYANDLKEGEMDEWAKELSERENTTVVPLYFNICDFDAVVKAVMRIKKEQGRIDVLANNAGIVTYEPLLLIDFDKLRKMFEVNVIAMIHLIQMVSKVMKRQKSGSIINMASIVGLKGAKGQLSYSATKGAVISTTLSASKELAEYNIRVNAVAPGMVATERFKNEIEGRFEERLQSVGMGRFADPEEIADVYSFFASDRSKYVTGQVLGVEGSFAI